MKASKDLMIFKIQRSQLKLKISQGLSQKWGLKSKKQNLY